MQMLVIKKAKSESSSFSFKNIRNVYFSLILFGLCFNSCSKEKIDAPVPIKELIANSGNCDSNCPTFVDKYLWRNKTVYIYTCNGPACDCMVFYYDENGERITMEQGYQFDNFLQEAQLVKHVWRCKK